MRIDDLLAQGTTTSFEFFPPKNDDEERALDTALAELAPPAARASSRSPTAAARRRARAPTGSCAACTRRATSSRWRTSPACTTPRDELVEILGDYRDAGIENLMLLGGDVDPERGAVGELRHADRARRARARGRARSASASPRSRRATPTRPTSRRTGATSPRSSPLADFAATQLFFEADEWRRLVDDLARARRRQARAPGHHARDDARRRSRGCATWAGRCRGGSSTRLEAASPHGPAAVRAAGVARGDRAVPRPARDGRAGAALLHAEPLDGDEGDRGRASRVRPRQSCAGGSTRARARARTCAASIVPSPVARL